MTLDEFESHVHSFAIHHPESNVQPFFEQNDARTSSRPGMSESEAERLVEQIEKAPYKLTMNDFDEIVVSKTLFKIARTVVQQ